MSLGKAGKVAGSLVAIAAVITLPISFVSWAEEQTEEKIKEAALIAEGREQVIHSTQQAKHDYDFFSMRAEQAESELIDLEQELDEGVALTTTQQRKMDKLIKQLDDFEARQEQALEQLTTTEHDDHEEEEN